jgi:hypothetical protein
MENWVRTIADVVERNVEMDFSDKVRLVTAGVQNSLTLEAEIEDLKNRIRVLETHNKDLTAVNARLNWPFTGSKQ